MSLVPGTKAPKLKKTSTDDAANGQADVSGGGTIAEAGSGAEKEKKKKVKVLAALVSPRAQWALSVERHFAGG